MTHLNIRSPNTNQQQDSRDQAIYQIKVRGWLNRSWSDWFDGLSITNTEEPDHLPVTILTGSIIDQAALHGLLNKIFNLGLPLLAVNCIRSKTSDSSQNC